MRARAGYAALNDTSIQAAVKACKAENATFHCPKTVLVYGKIQDWDTSKVTSFRNRAQFCRSLLWHC